MSWLPFCGSFRITTTRVPSGETPGCTYEPGAPIVLTTCPFRSNTVSCRSWGGGTAMRMRSPSRLILATPGASGIASDGRNSCVCLPTSNDGDVFTETAMIARLGAR